MWFRAMADQVPRESWRAWHTACSGGWRSLQPPGPAILGPDLKRMWRIKLCLWDTCTYKGQDMFIMKARHWFFKELCNAVVAICHPNRPVALDPTQNRGSSLRMVFLWGVLSINGPHPQRRLCMCWGKGIIKSFVQIQHMPSCRHISLQILY